MTTNDLNTNILLIKFKYLNKWNDIPTIFTDQQTQYFKMFIPTKFIYRFNTIPIKIPIGFLKKLTSYSQMYVEKLRLLE